MNLLALLLSLFVLSADLVFALDVGVPVINRAISASGAANNVDAGGIFSLRGTINEGDDCLSLGQGCGKLGGPRCCSDTFCNLASDLCEANEEEVGAVGPDTDFDTGGISLRATI